VRTGNLGHDSALSFYDRFLDLSEKIEEEGKKNRNKGKKIVSRPQE